VTSVIRYHARHVLPISASPIANGTVVVDGGRIAYVGARAQAPHGIDVDLGDAVLLPGLVNAHCHLELTAMRGFLEEVDFRGWILRLTSSKRAVLSRAMLLDSARYGIIEGLRHGITTYADTCDSGLAFDAMCERGVRGIMYQEVFGPDPAQCASSFAELREKVDRLRSLQTDTVRIGVSPHAPYTVSDALFSAVARYAKSESLPVAIHIAESQLEEDLVVRGGGSFAEGLRGRGIAVAARARSPIALLDSLDVLAAQPLLIHCVRADDADLALIARAHCAIAHCPISNAKLGHGIAPLTRFLDANIHVGLGSDSVASNNRMDLLEETRSAILLQRALLGAFDALTPDTALFLATLGGARALGLDREIGSLEVGKSADLAAFPLDGLRPVHDPIAAAVFALPGTRASFVAVAGRELVRDGAVTSSDAALEGRVQAAADLLQQWLRGN
jgi:5-methylthioadenosine/S-adenosylhomocysteine deaminase